MSIKRATEWRKLPVSLSELCIDTTLRCGQSFRWRKIDDEWMSTLRGRVLCLKQDHAHLHYKVTWPDTAALSDPQCRHLDDTEEILRRYFSLSLDLGALYEQWSKADPNFRRRAPSFTGVRILSQDAWEALLCFICSSNNNISRISQMAHKLCNHYGPLVGHIGGEPQHDFPTPESLTGERVESHLRELGFGYRSKYIVQTARIVALEKPPTWLESLRNPEHLGLTDCKVSGTPAATYKEAHDALLSLAGVGPKVADCVCLMGLGWGSAVPVDTHVWQIAQRDYRFGKSKTKTFNKVLYDAVGDHFRGIWGDYAGWAHSVLFAADLKEFSNRPTKEDVEALETQTNETKTVVGGRRKRVATPRTEIEVEMEVKAEVKVEETADGTTLEVGRVVKRRRTRGS